MSTALATIVCGGKSLAKTRYELLSIDILSEVNRIPYAHLTLVNNTSTDGVFAVSNSGDFDLGKEIEIKLNDAQQTNATPQLVFKGLVVGQSVVVERQKFLLKLQLKSSAVKLSQVPNSKVFSDVTDQELIKKLIDAHKLSAGTIPETKATHPNIVQYACSDWDFIVTRAEANGLLVCVDTNEKIALRPIELTEPKNTFKFGDSTIQSLEIEANANGQYGEVSSWTWDIGNQAMSETKSATNSHCGPGDWKSDDLANTLGGESRLLTSSAPIGTDELSAWSNAIMARNRLSLVRGRLTVPGLTGLALMDTIGLDGIGAHYNGKALVTGIRHRVNAGSWLTDIRIGLAADNFASKPDIAPLPAAGLLPPASGLQIGIVDDFEDDPDKQYRVKVKIPALGTNQPALWARLASPDAGNGRGFFFRPEKGDEVVLGFFNQDPRQPVIVGALYSSANPAQQDYQKPEEKNPLKGFSTKLGTRIAFNDKDEGKASLTIQTANDNKIQLDDDAKSLVLQDQHGNSITLDKNGITVKSAKDLKLEADGNVEIKGSKVDIK